jgi:hypothetical protein
MRKNIIFMRERTRFFGYESLMHIHTDDYLTIQRLERRQKENSRLTKRQCSPPQGEKRTIK